MKESGFTLAEVLITLGIIGVVAALTAPALVQNAGTAKIGPTLSKVVSTLENANEQMMHDEEINDLLRISHVGDGTTDANEYIEKLSAYIQGSSIDTTDRSTWWNPTAQYYDKASASAMVARYPIKFIFADNIELLFTVANFNRENVDAANQGRKGSFKGNLGNILIDINGTKNKPNVLGKDLFLFRLDRSGQVIPMGSSTFAWIYDNEEYKYTSSGYYACNETEVGRGTGCAGSIFENNFKVIYQ